MTTPTQQPTPTRRSLASALVLALCMGWSGPSSAQPTPQSTPQPTGDIHHQVLAGDTLEALARHYLDDAQQWQALARTNQVTNPRRLVPGSTLRIPQELLPYAPATVRHVHGQVQATLPGSSSATHLAAGQALPEGTQLQAGPESFISIRLHDGSIVRVQADSSLQLQRLRKQARPGSARSVIELQRGTVEPSVTPSATGARPLDIRTPMATASVRGTRFSASVEPDGRSLTAVTQGSVALQDHQQNHPETLLASGHGAVTGADGAVGQPAPLLAAPDLGALPASVHDADFLRLALPGLPATQAWQVQIARDDELTDTVRAARTTRPQLTLPAVPDGQYQVAVRLLDPQGLPGFPAQRALTVKAHPVAPLYRSPASDATLETPTLRLECASVSEAQRYRIQLAASTRFEQPLLDATSDGSCGADTPALAPGHYAWRTASLRQLPDGAWDQGPWAAPQRFGIAPQAPKAEAFTRGSSTQGGTTLSWHAQPGQQFRLQLARQADFNPPLVDTTLSEPSWSSGDLPAGRYYVRLRTVDPSGLQSAFSAPWLLDVVSRVDSGAGQAVTTSDGTPLQRP